MKNTHYSVAQLNRIKELLPYSYGRELQKRIKKTNGKDYTVAHIHKSMMYKNQNPRIIQAAIDLIIENGGEIDFLTIDNW